MLGAGLGRGPQQLLVDGLQTPAPAAERREHQQGFNLRQQLGSHPRIVRRIVCCGALAELLELELALFQALEQPVWQAPGGLLLPDEVVARPQVGQGGQGGWGQGDAVVRGSNQGGGHGGNGPVVAVGGLQPDRRVPKPLALLWGVEFQQHGSGADRWQLAAVAHQHQPALAGEGFEQGLHQGEVHHRYLVHNHQVEG